MADFTISGEVVAVGSGQNNVRGRVVAAINQAGAIETPATVAAGSIGRRSTGEVTATAVLDGRVTPSLRGTVSSPAVVAGRVSPAISGTISSPAVVGAQNVGARISGAIAAPAVLGGLVTPPLNVVSAPAVLGGRVLHQDVVGGQVASPAVLGGQVRRLNLLTGAIEAPATLAGAERVQARITDPAIARPGEVAGTLRREQSASTSAEAGYETTGKRKSTPALVYLLEVLEATDLSAVPVGGSFVVSASYVGAPGQSFYEAGASADAVGTKLRRAGGTTYLAFRRPVDDEVAWYVPEERLIRFRRDPESHEAGWRSYVSLPERALAGQYWPSVFDPDGIYKYYAKLWGALMWQWSYDNRVLLDQHDPDTCSRHYLPALAAQWGLTLDAADELAVNRAKTKSAVPSFKFKGMERAVELRLRALGLSGYVRELWVDPDHGTNFQSAVLNPVGEPSSGPQGAGTVYREEPHGYRSEDPSDGFFLSSRVSVHVNAVDGSPIDITNSLKQLVARELRQDVLPVHVDVRFFATDFNVRGNGGVEAMGVSDTLVISEVDHTAAGSLAASAASASGSGTVA